MRTVNSRAARTHTRNRWARGAELGFVVLPALAIVFGALALARNLPYDFFPYFWDGANLLRDAGAEGFLTRGPVKLPSYALLKYGYAAPIHLLVRIFGYGGVLAVNLFWYGVMLAAGVWTLRRQRDSEQSFPWAGVLAFAAGMICLPYIHKYIGTANPTIQSMALWFVLLLIYKFRRGPDGVFSRGTLALGIVSALIILTDFPKWAIVLAPALLIAETVNPVHRGRGWRHSVKKGIPRALRILVWPLLATAAAAAIVPEFFRNNVLLRLLSEGSKMETLRPALSWNFPIFLWTLGGFLVLLFIVVYHRRIPPGLRREPGIAVALTVMGLFSCLIWPRNARMFAVVVPFLLFIFSAMAQTIHDHLRVASRSGAGGDNPAAAQHRMLIVSALVILVSFLVRAPYAGECFKPETGVRKVIQFVDRDPRLAADSLLGTYLLPNFELATTAGHVWRYVPTYLYTDMKWVLTGDMISEIIIAEQAFHGVTDWRWHTKQLRMLETFRSEPAIAQFPCNFYVSKWYLVESNYGDGHLAFMLRRASEVKDPMWRLHFVAGLAPGSTPGSNGADTTGAAR